MDYLSNIQKEVQSRLAEKHSEIVISAYKIMLKKHNSNCDCDYCKKLDDYILAKQQLRHIEIQLGYNFFDISLLYKLDLKKEEVKNLKQEKDKLKELLL